MNSENEMHDFDSGEGANCRDLWEDNMIALTLTAPLRYLWHRYVRGLSVAAADRAVIAHTVKRTRRA